ncbi:MAG: hypothetical protein WAT12_04390 [Candidatus Nitrotoga sp.]
MTTQKKLDTSFKLKVVRLIQEQGLSVQHASQSTRIGLTAIRCWVTLTLKPSKVDSVA